MPNWRERRATRKAQRELNKTTSNKLSTQDVVNNANNDLSLLDNASNNRDSTTAKHSDRVTADIKKETTGQSTISTEPGTSYVETSTPHSGGASTMLGFEPLSSSDNTTKPSTSTTTDASSYYSGVSQKRRFLPGYKNVKSESAEQHYTDEQSSGRLNKGNYVPIGHGTLTKKQKRTVKKMEKEKKRRAKRDVTDAEFTKYVEKMKKQGKI